MKSKKAIAGGEGMIPPENRYLVTFGDGDDKVHQSEVTALSMTAAVSGNSDPSDFV
jgi:hypothetical protein